MPQMFLVLKCYKCLVFQVHQSRKTNKFVCKMCGEKQSIKRHYGIGNGQECRIHVQKLNGIRGELDESKSFGSTASSDEDDDLPLPVKRKVINHSKWSDFVEKDETTEKTNEDIDKMFLEDTEVVLEVPKKKRQKRFGDSHKKFKGKQQTESAEIIKQETELDKQDLCYSQPHDVVINVPTAYRRDKYQKIDSFPATTSKKRELQLDSDNVETIDINLFSQNINKDLKTTKNLIKFKPPLPNPNSKWAKFTEYETNEEDIEEQPSTNCKEPHSEGDNTFKLVNAQSNLHYPDENVRNSELLTIINHEEFHSLESTDAESLKQYVEDGNKKVFNPINTDETGSNHSQKDLKGFFALCDDNEIDDFLDI